LSSLPVLRARRNIDLELLHAKLLGLQDTAFPHMLLEEAMTQPAAMKAAGFTEKDLSIFG